MGFITDRQTLEDLNLYGRYKKNSIIGIFDHTHTRVSRQRLEEMFHNPLSSPEEINARSAVFTYFKDNLTAFPFNDNDVDDVDGYIASDGHVLAAKIKQIIFADPSYNEIQSGLTAMLRLCGEMHAFMKAFADSGSPFSSRIRNAECRLDFDEIKELHSRLSDREVSFRETAKIDRYVRKRYLKAVKEQLDILYDIDVCLSVAAAAVEKGLTAAKAISAESNTLMIKGVFHPTLKKAVGNDIDFSEKNVFFLTGVNMAGKSTFMKSVSIALYLAQVGFPVPAGEMVFSPVDGIYTSINVPDNIAMGYSHFYAEVLRVKHIAEDVASGKKLFIIFDELFKGTNVKDAFEATLSVTSAFAKHRSCMFIISTHIIEVGEELAEKCDRVQFHYLPSDLMGNRPVYSYKLRDGICSDRFGMTIIRNEHIIDIIKGEKNV